MLSNTVEPVNATDLAARVAEHDLSLPDVARITGQHSMTVRNAVLRGELKSLKVGHRYRFRAADVAAYLGVAE